MTVNDMAAIIEQEIRSGSGWWIHRTKASKNSKYYCLRHRDKGQAIIRISDHSPNKRDGQKLINVRNKKSLADAIRFIRNGRDG